MNGCNKELADLVDNRSNGEDEEAVEAEVEVHVDTARQVVPVWDTAVQKIPFVRMLQVRANIFWLDSLEDISDGSKVDNNPVYGMVVAPANTDRCMEADIRPMEHDILLEAVVAGQSRKVVVGRCSLTRCLHC